MRALGWPDRSWCSGPRRSSPWAGGGREQAASCRSPSRWWSRPMLYSETIDTLRRGRDALGAVGAAGSERSRPHRASTRRPALDPRRLRSGLVFSFRRTDRRHRCRAASASAPPRSSGSSFRRVSDGWDAVVEPIAWQPEDVRIEGSIDNSLYEALDAQVGDDQSSMPASGSRLAWDLADVYAWQIDFTRDVQPGDRFQVVFERLVSEEGEIRFGRVLASDLTMSGKSMTAFRFEQGGRSAFYDAAGNSLRRAFLRAPVQFRRISSSFARARRHPVLGITRRHEGTDYAAAPGTPVMAAGDGVVLRAGRAGGYGNLIELRHRNGITTRYGHLRGFARGIRAGARVVAGPDDRLRRLDRPRERPAPALRVPGERRRPGTPAGSSSATAPRSARTTARSSSASATACCAADAAAPAIGRRSRYRSSSVALRRSSLDLYPAIDIRSGRVVRLSQGEATRQTVYGDGSRRGRRAIRRRRARGGSTWWISTAPSERATTTPRSARLLDRVGGPRPDPARGRVSHARSAPPWPGTRRRPRRNRNRGGDRSRVRRRAAAEVGAAERLAVGIDARDGHGGDSGLDRDVHDHAPRSCASAWRGKVSPP